MLLVALALAIAITAAWPWLSRFSRARRKGEETSRMMVLRDIVIELQEAAGGPGASHRPAIEDLRRIVEEPSSRFEPSTGEELHYELVWDGRPIPKEDLGRVVIVRESALASDGRRGVAFADGRVEFVDR